jgi:hypothetical protein
LLSLAGLGDQLDDFRRRLPLAERQIEKTNKIMQNTVIIFMLVSKGNPATTDTNDKLGIEYIL